MLKALVSLCVSKKDMKIHGVFALKSYIGLKNLTKKEGLAKLLPPPFKQVNTIKTVLFKVQYYVYSIKQTLKLH